MKDLIPIYLEQEAQRLGLTFIVIFPSRASVRAGGTGGLPPVDLEQRVAATRPDLQPLITIRQKN